MTYAPTFEDVLTPTADPAWVLVERDCDPLRESSYGSRFAVSNGFLGIRATPAFNRAASSTPSPGTYVAGLFESPAEGAAPVLVTAPGWLGVSLLPRGLGHAGCVNEVSSHRLTLDMKRGAYATEFLLTHPGDVVIRVRTLHLVSMHERALGLQLMELQIEQGEFDATLAASFDGLEVGLAPDASEPGLWVWRSERSSSSVALDAEVSLSIDGEARPPSLLGRLEWLWSWRCRPGQTIHLDRLVAISRGGEDGPKTRLDAQGKLRVAKRLGWRGVVAEHETAWSDRRDRGEVEVEGDPAALQALRFAVYHLNSAANPVDDRVSIGARALTGEDYHGHVFWDTEVFLLPFYSLTWPEAARALLMYRFHTLDGARAKAAAMGWRGALYAWESADTGQETTPDQVIGPDRRVVDVLSGKQEQHISADIAYAVWNYWRITRDKQFLRAAGAEILLETSRFWASRARLEADGRRHIRGVMGPDEYHENIDDNAFTNVMARWNIERGLEVATLFKLHWPEDWNALASHLGLGDDELDEWRQAALTIATGLSPETGLFEQFSGYFGLEEINLADYAGRSVPMDVVLGRGRTGKSKVIKQADVVALLALLPEEFAGDEAAANFNYYEPRCSHGSSLSRALHGVAAARLGYTEMALCFFQKTAEIDLADTHVAIGGGIHIGALGGLWQIAVLGFAGLTVGDDGLAFHPKLPASWKSLSFSVQWRGRRLKVKIDRGDRLEATGSAGEPLTIFVDGVRRTVGP